MPRLRLILSAAILAGSTACDEPTAPQVRDRVEAIQQTLFNDQRPARFTADLHRTLTFALGDRQGRFPADLIEVQSAEGTTRYLATVMERVYLPPPPSGGAPYARRTLLAWDSESRRGFAFAADDSVASIVYPTSERQHGESPARLYDAIGFATRIDDNGRDGWFGTEGTMEIAAGVAAGSCKFKDLGNTTGFGFVDSPSTGPENCQQMRYQVSANATLLKGDPSDGRNVLDKLIAHTTSLRVLGQTVPGTRIVTQCPEVDAMTPPTIVGCMSRHNFWRSQAQFADSLGVDLSRMRQTNQPGIFYQALVDGAGPSGECCRFLAPHLRTAGGNISALSGIVIRYTVRDAKGAVRRHTDSTLSSTDSMLSGLYVTGVLRQGSRGLFLVPARWFDRSASNYATYVLDLSVLSCPPTACTNAP